MCAHIHTHASASCLLLVLFIYNSHIHKITGSYAHSKYTCINMCLNIPMQFTQRALQRTTTQ